jgi:hypothetical protein
MSEMRHGWRVLAHVAWAIGVAAVLFVSTPLGMAFLQVLEFAGLASGTALAVFFLALGVAVLFLILLLALCAGRRSGWKGCTAFSFDQTRLYLRGRAPDGKEFAAQVEWSELIRVCLQNTDFYTPDRLFLLTADPGRTYLVPTELPGGPALVGGCSAGWP